MEIPKPIFVLGLPITVRDFVDSSHMMTSSTEPVYCMARSVAMLAAI